ncbi:MAG: DEAD/DEAH box helicase [Parcubacteria group bacterium]|nr:DEAD/DEAH box helicase [Parcubacteria group bacterium]
MDYYSENFEKIKRASKTKGWWRDHTLFIEAGEKFKISELLRQIVELGYEKTGDVATRGEFSQRGGFVTIWPINEPRPWRIEYLGNLVERLDPIRTRIPEPPRKPKAALGELERLQPGDYVVHLDHGIGIFRGFTQSPESQTFYNSHDRENTVHTKEWYFVIEYAPPREGRLPDRLLVPLSQAKKLSPYYGFETPTIHRLGSELWVKTKRRVREEVIKLAQELLSLYAKRVVSTRPPYPPERELEKSLASSFPHVETRDQLHALEEIEEDLEREKPMDRVLVGDVGFGKTEVALRSAFRAVLAGKQVALLAPTTILTHQHFHTFRERMKNFPVEIAELSRLVSKRETKEALKKIARGEIDIIIGTHRLLSRDVIFKDLGLLVIDEEQRFGVRAKEKLKQLRSEIDILALSATPIPRTMYLALSKLRDMSTLQTPPPGRIPIKTFVLPLSTRTIRETIEYELRRHGQVFVLSNRVSTIAMRTREIRQLVPHAEVGFIHGRLDEKVLLDTMEKFRDGKINVLVATTIIENGLDLSNVNTLIVMDSTRLGLGEAHQLRGRIGRGDRQAYAYFLYPSRRLPEKAKFRLRALQKATYLGAGYEIALKDLELRGAGNILGKEQSGAINAIGLNLYMHMLSETIESLKP